MKEKRVGPGLAAALDALNPLLRGWTSYFRCAQVKGVWRELDGLIRRKLRGLVERRGRPYEQRRSPSHSK